MAEDQNVVGANWNNQFNLFLNRVMGWKQLGTSNVDIPNPITRRKMGIDSVFSYKRNNFSTQELIIVEAKTYDLQRSVKNEIRVWINNLLEKLENLPASREFMDIFQPEANARCQLGLIGLLIRNIESYSYNEIQDWLSQLIIPKKRTPYNIGFVSNKQFNEIYVVRDTVNNLQRSGEFRSIEFFFPNYGDKSRADGNCLPFETFFTKTLFCDAVRVQKLMGSDKTHDFRVGITFHLGYIKSYNDLRFLGKTIEHFQRFESGGVIIYTLRDPVDLEMRNYIETFKKEFQEKCGNGIIEFRMFTPPIRLPSFT